MRLCGLDEAGRGAFAGPLVGVAVIGKVSGIKDSKLLNPAGREKIYRGLINSGAEIFIETISVELINEKGMGWANKEVFRRLIKKIKADRYLIDGNLEIEGAESMVDADATIPEVILAGIVAKVERDKIMKKLHKEYPEFDWIENKGYGTKKHLEKIKERGITPQHRTAYVATALSPVSRRATTARRAAAKTRRATTAKARTRAPKAKK